MWLPLHWMLQISRAHENWIRFLWLPLQWFFFLCSSFSFVSMRNGWPTCILAMIICSSANCGGVEEGLSVFCLFLFIVTVCLCDWNQARFSPQRTICTTSSSWFHFDWTLFKSWLWLDLNRHFHLKILHPIFISILKSLFIVFYLLNVAINRQDIGNELCKSTISSWMDFFPGTYVDI